MNSDVIVVGSGIVGLACAWAAWQQGQRVRVIDRDPFCVGASIRNFGFVTVTGQGRGDTWRRARRSRDVWAQLAPEAGIAVEHEGLYVLAQRTQAKLVLQELLKHPEGADLRWLERTELHVLAPHLGHANVCGALYSPYELRIEAREAIEKLRHYLAQQGVEFLMGKAVQEVVSGAVLVDGDWLKAERIVVCPGPDISTLFPDIFARVLSGAPDIRTLDPAHLAVGDVERDIVSHAVQAEAMRTLLDAVEILRVVVFVTE
jgi:FAD dependent oxidoreductase TIGR03364